MKPLKLFSLLLAVILPACSLLADPGSHNRPYFVRSAAFLEIIHKNFEPGSGNNKMPETTAASAKVCACQIMQVTSNNEKLEYLAVFAEKTNYGEMTNSFLVAKNVLEKEKKQMKDLFYPKMKVIKKYTSNSNCKTLAGQLISINSDLKVYEILDADILGSTYLNGKK